ncbi:MAG TPA: hypothetical protein O0W80_03805 [Methanocorpusculum sp.]|nr:hypothetical protein [Methanocorpusculum sp.]
MTDLREAVKEDRGILKKIQLFIPGFSGYRKKEDLRIADSMLRNQVADNFKTSVLIPIEMVREHAANSLELDLMNDIAGVLSKAKTLESSIRHAEQGYSGISAAVRIREDELDKLYEYDLSLFEAVNALALKAKEARGLAENGAFSDVKTVLFSLKSDIMEFSSVFDRRMETIAGIEVT